MLQAAANCGYGFDSTGNHWLACLQCASARSITSTCIIQVTAAAGTTCLLHEWRPFTRGWLAALHRQGLEAWHRDVPPALRSQRGPSYHLHGRVPGWATHQAMSVHTLYANVLVRVASKMPRRFLHPVIWFCPALLGLNPGTRPPTARHGPEPRGRGLRLAAGRPKAQG